MGVNTAPHSTSFPSYTTWREKENNELSWNSNARSSLPAPEPTGQYPPRPERSHSRGTSLQRRPCWYQEMGYTEPDGSGKEMSESIRKWEGVGGSKSMAASLLKQWLNPVATYWRVGASRAEQWLPLVVPNRSIVFGKKGKRKTVKAVAKRFKRTGSGKLKYWRSGKSHRMMSKSARASRQLRKPCYANKTQLKTLNKMLSGW